MANENIFSNKTKEYAAGRLGYAPAAVERLCKMLTEGDRVADIGSGTGIFSKELLRRGFDTYCVEPNAAMRAEAEWLYGALDNFHSIGACAEDTGLEANSFSLITAASAFHWFDAQAFSRECRRILRPNGIVCIIMNARVYDAFTQKQHEICKKYCPSYTSLAHGSEKTLRIADAFFGGRYSIEKFDFALDYTKQNFIARSLSSSYAPEKGSVGHEPYIRALQKLMDDCFDGENLTVLNETVMLWGALE